MSKEYRGQVAEAPMTESWKQFQGHTVNGEFELREYLGGSAHSAAFLTEYDHRATAIHLVSENAPEKDRQLASWQLGTEVSHPNLLQVFQVGLGQFGDAKFYYAVMEMPDENLGQILKQRALSAEETSAMLPPALDALSYLHKRNLVHGAMKPSNIGAIGEALKLSIDGLARSGEANRAQGAYDPPEITFSAASDVWSLGMTIVEVLTLQLPRWERYEEGEPEIPANVPEPLLNIARNCLRRDSRRRWAVKEIAERLNPIAAGSVVNAPEPEIEKEPASSAAKPKAELVTAVAPKTAAMSEPKSALSANVTATATAKAARPGRISPPGYASPRASKQASAPKRGNFRLIAILLAAAAAFGGYKLLHRSPAAPQSSVPTQTAEPGPAQNVAPREQEAQAPSENLNPNVAPPTKETPARSARSKELPAETSADAGVVHQILPDVPEKAARTIHGKFHVTVKATTDVSGNVTDATLDSAGPSQYFANLALKAARQWKFAAGNGSGDWLIRFEFTAAGTTASAKPSR